MSSLFCQSKDLKAVGRLSTSSPVAKERNDWRGRAEQLRAGIEAEIRELDGAVAEGRATRARLQQLLDRLHATPPTGDVD